MVRRLQDPPMLFLCGRRSAIFEPCNSDSPPLILLFENAAKIA